MRLTLFQTLKDKDNPDEVEEKGPFKCIRNDAWLGFGYYFWDSHIELGHWWGKLAFGNSNYIICRATGVMDNNCWDLQGNGEHRLEFKSACDQVIEKGIMAAENLTVAKLILYLQKGNVLRYNSIRALGMNSMSNKYSDPEIVRRVKFIDSPKHFAFLDLHPPVQICLFEKKALSLRDYRIVYPEEYIDNTFA